MVAVLLMTETFRGNGTVPRWRHPQWLAWLVVTQSVDAKKSLRDLTRRAIPRRRSGPRQRAPADHDRLRVRLQLDLGHHLARPDASAEWLHRSVSPRRT